MGEHLATVSVADHGGLHSAGHADDIMPTLASVAKRHGIDGLAARLGGVQTWLASDLGELEMKLRSVGSTGDNLGWRSASYLLARPGKRIRPVCVALAARLGGRAFDKQVQDAAAACELVHTATLLHDDVIDEGDLRRGAPAARRVYGNSASVLGGDHLLVAALRCADAVPTMRLALLDTLTEMVGAEALQLARRRQFTPDREVYERIVAGKTAALFRWALEAGATMGGLSRDHVSRLGHFGLELGVAFQLVDDALDLDGDPAVTGKSALTDLREGKLTWPLLIASERCPDVAVRLAVMASSEADIDPEIAALLVAQIRETGAVAATHEKAAQHAESACEALRPLPDGRAKAALLTVVDAALQRRH